MDQKYIAQISEALGHQMRELLVHFDVAFEDQDNLLVGVCPIHDGADNPTAFTIDLEEGEYFGYWRCWTKSCEKDWLHSPVGLVRALLSRQRGKKVTFNEAMRFCLNFIKMDKKELHEKAKNTDFSTNRPKRKTISVPRDVVRKSLVRPVMYYVNRGYSEKVLDEFDVGACWEKGKPMYGRAVAPVYNEDNNMIGCVGRVMHEDYNGHKWINSKNFNCGSYLYGYWLSAKHIRETKTVVIVEGQGDVWRLWEAGIKNVVGIFGSSLSDAQCRTLETSGALSIVILTDNDEAGLKAKKSIRQKCDRLFNIIEPVFDKNDVGDMSIDEINETIKPQIQGYVNV